MDIRFTRYITKPPSFVERTRSEYYDFPTIHRFLRRYGGCLTHDNKDLLELPIGYTFSVSAINYHDKHFTIPHDRAIPFADWILVEPKPIIEDDRTFYKIVIDGLKSPLIEHVDIGRLRPLWSAWVPGTYGWRHCGFHFHAQIACQIVSYYWIRMKNLSKAWSYNPETDLENVLKTDEIIHERQILPGYYAVPQPALEQGRDRHRQRNGDARKIYNNFLLNEIRKCLTF